MGKVPWSNTVEKKMVMSTSVSMVNLCKIKQGGCSVFALNDIWKSGKIIYYLRIMIHRHYNPWHITNDGERAADRQFILPAGSQGEVFHVIHQLRISSRFHKTQMVGECDFVIFTQHGILVMEVKGGLIGYGLADNGDQGFYRLVGDNEKEAIRNPFTQADANADAIRKFLKEKGLINIFVGTIVCFPECAFDAEGIDFHYLWHLDCRKELTVTILDAIREQVADFGHKQSLRNVAFPVKWKSLEEKEIFHVLNLLTPEFKPQLYRMRTLKNHEESVRRAEEGLHVLEGLSENRRIMVQGPPGSGKTTYAFCLISRLCLNEGKKGLYLCWNDLLAASIKEKVRNSYPKIPEENIHISSLFYYIDELAGMVGDSSLKPTFDHVKKREIRQLINECLSRLHRGKALPKYDFIIADEAQDLFEKGLDLLIKSLLKDNNPLQKGNYYIFYDDSQAYPWAPDHDAYIRTRDALKEASAHYTLFSNLRINTGEGLTELIQDAGMGIADPLKAYGKDVTFISCKNASDLLSSLRQYIEQEKTLCQYKWHEMMVLFSSGLMKEGSPLKELLTIADDFELMLPENSNQNSGKVLYTKILKSKGLEWDVVFLACSDVKDPLTQYQLFIGASRAKGKLYCYITVINH